ncbi:hypothetical protein ABK046_34365 [Streptomyces caeruleatus]
MAFIKRDRLHRRNVGAGRAGDLWPAHLVTFEEVSRLTDTDTTTWPDRRRRAAPGRISKALFARLIRGWIRELRVTRATSPGAQLNTFKESDKVTSRSPSLSVDRRGLRGGRA